MLVVAFERVTVTPVLFDPSRQRSHARDLLGGSRSDQADERGSAFLSGGFDTTPPAVGVAEAARWIDPGFRTGRELLAMR
jgi:hypothetical protein